ncbi:EARP and GARP complex-interacting protein 1 isoform X7 [Hippopotamus amphibius kiboko]|uniref:EARP and GARP complex-interacting protein 1 isoform X7 n=1 Tax=Hippopotamus amphibius kiboko TaxID=575201 RepID=UPI0025949B83|nr:EARP and GARP complex-interacting protein 1 isoform X7 [Hippopotamus amphibius kiboko]
MIPVPSRSTLERKRYRFRGLWCFVADRVELTGLFAGTAAHRPVSDEDDFLCGVCEGGSARCWAALGQSFACGTRPALVPAADGDLHTTDTIYCRQQSRDVRCGVEDARGAGAGRPRVPRGRSEPRARPGAALSPGPCGPRQHCLLASSASLEGKGQLKFTTGRWSPHHNCTQVATANDTAVRGWDTRTMSQIYCIESAHGQLVRDLDFNPNKQYYLASCGDDCRVKFWDTRNVTEPVKTLEEHSHWVWNVRYNHSHDQLVLTGSSDSRVILSNMVSISSEPFGHLVDEDDLSDQEERRPEEKSQEPPHDSVVATYEEHEDSVYAVDWSSADPWLFASLSYDGRLVINRVPRALKYHILL